VTLRSLATARLVLTAVTRDDVDALWHVWRQADVRRYQFDDVEVTRERAAEVVDAALADARAGLGLWVIREAGRDAVVGVAGLRPVAREAEARAGLGGLAEVIVSLAPAVWRRGYAREAVGAVIAYAFTSLKLTRLAAVVDEPNAASHRLVQWLGFTRVGDGVGPRYAFRAYVLVRPI
jgi:RimJ/RimL family protein N-acetyltransferase